MLMVSRSTRNLVPNAEVLTADRLLALCHLAGKAGAHISRDWTSENVLDAAETFLVNPYLSIDVFSGSKSLYSRSRGVIE